MKATIGTLCGLALFQWFFVVGTLTAVELEVTVLASGTSTAEASSSSPEPPTVATVSVEIAPEAPGVPDQEVSVPGTARFDVPEGSSVRLSISAPGYWSPDQAMVLADQPEQRTVKLLPLATITGTLQIPAGEPSVERLSLQVRPAPDGSARFAPLTWECPVASLKFECAAPAGTVDLRLRAPGFLTHNFWGLELPAHDRLSVDELILERGASVVGWVVPPQQSFDFTDVTVTLQPSALGPLGGPGEESRQQSLRETARVNAHGFFQLRGVPPGYHVLLIDHPDYARHTVFPVRVLENMETEIHRIELQPAARFRLELWPPRHPLGPWHTRLDRLSPVPGHSKPVAQGRTSPEGTWEVAQLDPGSYRLQVRDARGSTWTTEEIELTPDSPPFEIELPMVRLEGLITLEDEPVPATIHFGGRNAEQSIVIRSNEEGRFYVFLPQRDDPWMADIESPSFDIDTRVFDIEVDRAPDEPWAKTHIELPATRLDGVVVDTEGQPVPQATVRAAGAPFTTVEAQTDEEGRFELRALRPGEWRVEASHWDGEVARSSSTHTVEIPEDASPPSLRLVLRQLDTVEGLVTSPTGAPVPGALVTSLVEQGGSFGGQAPAPTSTGADGTFDIRLPADAAGVQLTIYPPGFAVTQLRVSLPSSGPVVVPVEAEGGTVVLSFELDDGEELVGSLIHSHLFHDYLLPGWWHLDAWARGHGVRRADGRWTLPHLPPGPYTACTGLGEAPYLTGRVPPGAEDHCVEGFLSPGGQLILAMPEAPPR